MKRLTTPKRKAIAALLVERSVVDAARAAGVGERTLHRWLRDPVFLAELDQAEADMIGEATRQLVNGASDAVRFLLDVVNDNEDVINNSKADLTNRRLAAQAVINHMIKIRELQTIERRLVDLELKVYG